MKYSIDQLNLFMDSALEEAAKAEEQGEVPVGAVVVVEGNIVAGAGNRIEEYHDATAHAELLAISLASRRLSNFRLDTAVLCATLEPCAMCTGAILLARIPVIVFGAEDPRFGALGSRYDLSLHNPFGPQPRVVSGIKKESCSRLLSDFFRRLRT